MKKLKLTIISTLILALGCVSFLFPTKAYASVVYNNEQEQAFFESYEAVCTLNLQGGITASNVEEYYSVSGAGVLAGEEAEALTEGFLLTYRNEREVLTVAYKNANKFKMENSFDLSELAPTENGVILVSNTLATAKTAINNAVTKAEIDGVYNEFITFIQSSAIVRNVTVLSTSDSSEIVASVATANKIFSPDDVLLVKLFNDSVIIRNTKLALVDNLELPVENGGVAKYFSVRWIRNGVIMEDTEVPVTVTVSLESLGIDAENGETVSIVRYLGNGKVAFTNASIVSGNLIFNLTSFGGDIATEYDLDFAIVLAGYPVARQGFMFEYWQIVCGAIAVIAVIYLISKMIKVGKRSKTRKEFRKFKKEQKLKKKQAKLEKKQVKENKKVKPIGGTNVVKPKKAK